MQAEYDPLAALRDIHLPKAVSFWPPAPGWIIITTLIVLLCSGLIWIGYRYLRRQRIKKLALQRLQALQAQYQQSHQGKEIVTELSILLRRVALAYFPRKEIAGLTGKPWLSFLQSHGQDCDFEQVGALLLSAPYQAQIKADLTPLMAVCLRWIKQRR
ncbi:MAG: DUF4381 domain-containing protein [Gammaproteobacteria bacterium]